MTSEATVMSKPDCAHEAVAAETRRRSSRSARSFMSSTRRHWMRRGLMSSGLPQYIELSSIAESRLCAEVMAWKSPVKWRLMSSMGTTCA